MWLPRLVGECRVLLICLAHVFCPRVVVFFVDAINAIFQDSNTLPSALTLPTKPRNIDKLPQPSNCWSFVKYWSDVVTRVRNLTKSIDVGVRRFMLRLLWPSHATSERLL